jgi:hypothetical protein
MSLAGCVPVAKRIGRQVRIDEDVVREASVVAAIRDVSLVEYLSSILRPIVARDCKEAMAEKSRADQAKPKR